MSTYTDFVKEYAKDHNLSYRDAMKQASSAWRAKKGKKVDIEPSSFDIEPSSFDIDPTKTKQVRIKNGKRDIIINIAFDTPPVQKSSVPMAPPTSPRAPPPPPMSETKAPAPRAPPAGDALMSELFNAIKARRAAIDGPPEGDEGGGSIYGAYTDAQIIKLVKKALKKQRESKK